MMKPLNLRGRRFGSLRALSPTEPDERYKGKRGRWWLCLCDCGRLCKQSASRISYLQKHLEVRAINCGGCSGVKDDLTGRIFGRLNVLKLVSQDPDGLKRLWLCRCVCGGEVTVVDRHLLKDKRTTCGCTTGKVPEDLIGRKFGKLKVLDLTEIKVRIVFMHGYRTRRYDQFWKCRCRCGRLRTASSTSLLSRATRSCMSCSHNRRPSRQRRSLRNERILEGWNQGRTMVELSDAFDLTRPRIHQILTRAGATFGPPRRKKVHGAVRPAGRTTRKRKKTRQNAAKRGGLVHLKMNCPSV